jgi:Flp pilus assembly pilin Flp
MPPQHPKLAGKVHGQGLTEYIIVVALIAIVTIGVITLFGDSVRQLFGMSTRPAVPDPAPDPTRGGKRAGTTTTVSN